MAKERVRWVHALDRGEGGGTGPHVACRIKDNYVPCHLNGHVSCCL